MADFTALKTAIQNAIKQNGNEEITGNILQDVLLAIVSTLGDGSINDLITALGSEATTRGNADTTLQQNINAEAQARQLADSTLQGGINTVSAAITAINNAIGNGCVYAGIATPSSTPASGKVFYLALTAGTYTNYGGLEVPQGINILKNNGSTWSLDSFLGIDNAPTPSSNNLVKSGGVFDKVMTDGSAFDISAHFASGGTLATYANLSAALTALNTLSAAYKKGGMSIKFVQSSDNKYQQYRLKTQVFSAIITDWESINETEQKVNALLTEMKIEGYTESVESDAKSTASIVDDYAYIKMTGNAPYTGYEIKTNSEYRVYGIDVKQGEEYSINSINYNYIKSAILVDSNENLIRYFPLTQSSTQTMETTEIVIPEGVAKMYINENKNSPCTIKKKQIDFSMTNETKENFAKIADNEKLLNAIEIQGYVKQPQENKLNNGNITKNTALYLNENDRSEYVTSPNSAMVYYTLDVVAGEEYRAKGFSYNYYKPVIITDANNEVIAYYPIQDNSPEADIEVKFVIPENGVRMYISGLKNHDNYCYKTEMVYNMTDLHTIITGMKKNSQIEGLDMTWFAKLTPDYVNYLTSDYDAIKQNANSVYDTYELSVIKGEKYKVKGISYNYYKTAILTNANNDLIAYYPIERSSSESVVESEFEIPEGCTKLLVMKNKNLDFYFKRIGLPIFDVAERSGFFNPLYKKHLCTCGDSLTAAVNVDVDTQTAMHKSYGWHVAYRNMMHFVNMGVSGETLCSTCLETGAYKVGFSETRYQNIPIDADYITIFYGWNDEAYGTMQYKDAYCVEHFGTHYGSCTNAQKAECDAANDWLSMFIGTINDDTCHTWYGGWNIVLGWLRENRPNAHIGVILPYVTPSVYRTTLIELCKKFGVSWVNGKDPREWFSTGYSEGLSSEMATYLKGLYTSDSLHPNSVGHERISYLYEKWIRGL